MNKNICEFSHKDEFKHIKCEENNSPCLYERYCTQDSTWWVSDAYSNCQRRNKMKKNKKQPYSPIIEDNQKEEVIEIKETETQQIEKKELYKIVGKLRGMTFVEKDGKEKILFKDYPQEVGEFIEL